MEADAEIISLFLQESSENLEQADRDLIALETNPGDLDLLARVFRTVHTIKGTSGFLGFVKLQELAHAGESLLGALRDQQLQLDSATATVLLALMDAIRLSLAHIEAAGVEGDYDNSEVIEALRQLVEDPGSASAELSPAEPSPAPADAAVLAETAPTSVRVDVALLDSLMELVGELVVVRTQIDVQANRREDRALADANRRLRLVTGELEDHVMRARLQPIGMVTGRFRRVGRDLAAALGKQVHVEVAGEAVGVDRAVNDALRDPLLHIVRNGLDHGIEAPAQRVAAGKPATGLIRISASHRHGRVYVDVSDDGRGIDPAVLVRHAVRSGLISASQAQTLTPQQTLDLVFLPGLTTSEQVTNVSGRGVGMDVVRSNLQQVGGSVSVASTLQVGTVIHIDLPLTLAVMPVLIIECAEQRYAVPLANVLEIRWLQSGDVSTAPDAVDGALIYRLRGHLLPSVDLGKILGLEARSDVSRFLVVVSAGGRRFGLLVDRIADTDDVVVKPMTRAIRMIDEFAGVTIHGDGLPVLVLDVAGIANSAGLKAPSDEALSDEAVGGDAQPTRNLLLMRSDDGGRLAVDLDCVVHLQRVAADSVEAVGQLEVVRDLDQVLPLIRVSEVLPERRATPRDELPPHPDGTLTVVVCRSKLGPVGLVVALVEDIIAEPTTTGRPPSRHGTTACIIVGNHLAELLDVDVLAQEVVRPGGRS